VKIHRNQVLGSLVLALAALLFLLYRWWNLP
jgi:hypothetical protein